jgi:tRNA(fMet)-specific endonuclease VapC
MRYLLDTNVVSDLVRQPGGRIAARIAEVGESAICTSVIVAAELRYGAEKRNSPRLTRQVKAVLQAMLVLPIEPPVDERYGELRYHLEERGTPIGGNDLLIAAHALVLGICLVTDNTREFSRVPGLIVENWLR